MTRYRGRTVWLHAEAKLARAKATAAALMLPGDVKRRERDIRALPTVQWRGKTLHTLRCHGTSGRGPHDVHLPEAMLWHLLDLRIFRCVYHAGDDPLPVKK